jgi:hypothetical protein
MKLIPLAIAALAVFSSPAAAEVSARSDTGFTVTVAVQAPATASKAFDAFLQLPQWWDPAHTYTGDGAALSLDPVVGGCWCERFRDGGGIEHMRVIYIVPDGGPVRFRGGLGPLQPMGAHGVMTIDFEDSADGLFSTATLTYVVMGPAGTGAMAEPVDFVLNEAMARFAAFVPTHIE